MQSLQPFVELAGDRGDRIMSRAGELVGFTKTRAVWRYGFLPRSDAHKAYGVCSESFTWVLSEHSGKILETWQGFAIELPERFKKIIDGVL